MSNLSVHQRHAEAVARATSALRYLEAHPRTSRKQLGDARDALNTIYVLGDVDALRDYVEGIETLVVEVYGGHPGVDGDSKGGQPR